MITEIRKLVNALKNTKGAPSIKISISFSHKDEEASKVDLKTEWFSNVEGIKFCGILLKELTEMSVLSGKEYDPVFESQFPKFFSMFTEDNLDVFTKNKTLFPVATKIKSLSILSGGKETKIDISDKITKKAEKVTPIAKKFMSAVGL